MNPPPRRTTTPNRTERLTLRRQVEATGRPGHLLDETTDAVALVAPEEVTEEEIVTGGGHRLSVPHHPDLCPRGYRSSRGIGCPGPVRSGPISATGWVKVETKRGRRSGSLGSRAVWRGVYVMEREPLPEKVGRVSMGLRPTRDSVPTLLSRSVLVVGTRFLYLAHGGLHTCPLGDGVRPEKSMRLVFRTKFGVLPRTRTRPPR